MARKASPTSTISSFKAPTMQLLIVMLIYILREKESWKTVIPHSETNLIVQHVGVVDDAIRCLGLSNSVRSKILSKTESEKFNHYTWLHQEIDKLLSEPLNYHSWLGFSGPWIEDLWIEMKDDPFSTFGVFVPLFVPWVRMWITHHGRSPWYVEKRDAILSLLSPEYLYVTVSFNDDGIEGGDENHTVIPPNLLVISGGGKGHIPAFIYLHRDASIRPEQFPIADSYDYDLMFLGGMSHRIRKIMVSEYTALLGDKFFHHTRRPWRVYHQKAKFVCAPRGYGRNSYRLTEVLLAGMVPVILHSDIPWVPYYDSIDWNSIGIVAHISELNSTIDRIRRTTPEEINQMRKRIASLYDTHFSQEGLFQQIRKFLRGGFRESDLRCAPYRIYTGR